MARVEVTHSPACDELERTLWLIWSVWTLLVLAHLLGSWLGSSVPVLAGGLLAISIVWATRARDAGRPVTRRMRDQVGVALLGFTSGAFLFPVVLVATWRVGSTIGIPVEWLGSPTHTASRPVTLWISTLIAAPLLEEPLYRQRLQPVLRARLGTTGAVVAASLLFAAPHLLPWTILGAFLFGIVLGAVYELSASLTLCIAIHAGLNLRALWTGLPTDASQLFLLPDLIVAVVALSASLGWHHWSGCRQAGDGAVVGRGRSGSGPVGALRGECRWC